MIWGGGWGAGGDWSRSLLVSIQRDPKIRKHFGYRKILKDIHENLLATERYENLLATERYENLLGTFESKIDDVTATLL